MNKRIRELLLQATTLRGPPFIRFKVDQEKFAELIVRECIKKCQDHPSIIFKNEWDADVVAPDIVNRLESHFGVEE